MKKPQSVIALLLCVLLCLAALTACSNSSGGTTIENGADANGIITVANSPDEKTVNGGDLTPLGEASNLTFDFETLEYSFTGVSEAEFYYIRVFPMENGVESNSASFQSEKIDANDSNTYSGVIEGQTLLAGDYVAHVVASASGYTSSDIQVSGTSTLLAQPSLSANWNTGSEENPDVTADITITAGDAITTSFTLVVTNEAGEEVYRNDNAPAGSLNLTAVDLGTAALTVEDVYSVTVTVNPIDGYTLPDGSVTAQITERMMFGPGGPGGPPM